jgi:hypothetical protein
MVELIVGEKGKGKTREMLERANEAVKKANGSVIYLDRNNDHMFELNNSIRLINFKRYDLKSTDGFLGFVSGVLSQNKDIEYFFIDGFTDLAKIDVSVALEDTISALEKLSEDFQVNFILSVSRKKEDIPDTLTENVLVAL